MLAEDSKDRTAATERLLSIWSKGDVVRARKVGEELLRADAEAPAEVYVILGSVYDDTGDSKAAERTLRRGLDRYPTDSPLHFNLGVSLFRRDRLDSSAEELMRGLVGRPGHASGWLSLGEVERRRGRRAHALAAWSRFLTLEPDSKRSPGPARSLWQLLMAGVSRAEQKDESGKDPINLTIPFDEKAGGGHDAGAEAMSLALVGVTRHLKEWKDKSDAEFLVEGLGGVLAMQEARAEGHGEAMTYDIRRSLREKEIDDWIAAHGPAVDAFRKWSTAWKPASCTFST